VVQIEQLAPARARLTDERLYPKCRIDGSERAAAKHGMQPTRNKPPAADA
jgi:hypothetical protein